MFRDEFIYGTSKTWYQFKNHRWVNIGDGIPLRQKISNQLLNEYLRFSTKLTNETQSLDFDDPQRHIKIDQSEKLGKVMAKLKTNSFKKSLIDECI